LVNFGTESISNSGSWRIPLGIGFIWGFILGAGILFFPETPRFNYRHGKLDLAQESIANYHGVSIEHKVVKDMMAELAQKMREEEEGAEGRKWHEVFTGPRMKYRVLLGVSIQMFQQLTGMNYFM
jgi:MFS transporter, SP family, sugar:H+ symporter